VKQQEKELYVELLTIAKEFVTGTKITLKFKIHNNQIPTLFIHHSYGSTLVKASKVNDEIEFVLPSSFSKKTGVVNWKLIFKNEIYLKSNFKIIANTLSKTVLESYLGPTRIQAGNSDFSMLVVIPTDKFDNPHANNTPVKINNQFLNTINAKEEKTNHLIAWQHIYSRTKTGILLVSASCNGTNSKEFTSKIYASNPTNFLIDIKRNHEYADGNQLAEIVTSTILDEFENSVADGTLVDFIISNNEGSNLKVSASTLRGIASAKIIHPEKPDSWNVKGMVSGLATSNNLELEFKPAISNFNVSFSKENGAVLVGPLKSFMNQLIPDGALVGLHIYNNDILIETKSKTSNNGQVIFYLDSEFYKKESYSFKIEALGILKNIE
jgi:hypothetical protein